MRWWQIQNLVLIGAICFCTLTVALVCRSPAGLWSLLLALLIAYPTKKDAPVEDVIAQCDTALKEGQ